ncbi:hypothetical protein BaRGS_00007915, partial [Batillaria attramentaria]
AIFSGSTRVRALRLCTLRWPVRLKLMGPGTYEAPNTLTGKGGLMVTHDKRFRQSIEDKPGPGAYEAPTPTGEAPMIYRPSEPLRPGDVFPIVLEEPGHWKGSEASVQKERVQKDPRRFGLAFCSSPIPSSWKSICSRVPFLQVFQTSSGVGIFRTLSAVFVGMSPGRSFIVKASARMYNLRVFTHFTPAFDRFNSSGRNSLHDLVNCHPLSQPLSPELGRLVQGEVKDRELDVNGLGDFGAGRRKQAGDWRVFTAHKTVTAADNTARGQAPSRRGWAGDCPGYQSSPRLYSRCLSRPGRVGGVSGEGADSDLIRRHPSPVSEAACTRDMGFNNGRLSIVVIGLGSGQEGTGHFTGGALLWQM